MKKSFIILIFLVSTGIIFGQTEVKKKNLSIQKSTPTLSLDNPYTHVGSVIDLGNGDITLRQTTNTLTFTGGNYLFSGSIGATDSRITKGWFTNLEITNMPTVNGTSISTTIAGKVNIADTATMLSKYHLKTDARIAALLKVNVSDTATMLSKYALSTNVALKVNIADTSSMLNKYARKLNPVFTGAVTLPEGDTTVTPVKGKIIYKTSDNHFYGCTSTTANNKWKRLDAN